MISYLRGQIILSRPTFIILDVNGVGYRIYTNQSINDEKVELYIYQHLREDASDLYGFLSYQELELFEKLISVNGVGPKAGLNIMSAASPSRIIQAISLDDLSFFVGVPGIGKKVAAKIILDLKSKLTADKSINVIGKIDDADDLSSALEALGYKKAEIQSLITKLPADITSLEEKVRWCLQDIGKR